MLKKRLIGVVTVKNGWAVQSFGYQRYLPLGKPEVIVENLDRWGADEILLQCIDRSRHQAGPDFELLKRVGALGLSTPLIYAGGVRFSADAVQAVSFGADRILVDAMLWDAPEQLEVISRELGTQALIAHVPVQVGNNSLVWREYRSGRELELGGINSRPAFLDWVSEVMLTDWVHEGSPRAFDELIPSLFPWAEKPLLLFGGLSESDQLQRMLSRNNVVAVGVGNFLNYREHSIQQMKRNLVGLPVRAAHYADDNLAI